MKYRQGDKKERPLEFPPLPLWAEGTIGFFDPLASYTGRGQEVSEDPVQDVNGL